MPQEKTKEKIKHIKDKISEFKPIMDGLSRARNPFELRYFVIGKHDDRVQQYKQAVIEMDAKYKSIQEAVYNQRIKAIDKERIELRIIKKPKNRLEELKNEELLLKIDKIDNDDHNARVAMTGAFKEIMDFITIIENEYSDLIDKTEEDLLKEEVNYWKTRLSKQIHIELTVNGRIGEGNRSVLESMPQEIQEEILTKALVKNEEYKLFEESVAKKALIKLSESYPHKTTFIASSDHVPLKLIKDAPADYPQDKIVNIDRAEIMIATLFPPYDQKWLSQEFYIPTGKNYIKHFLICDNPSLIGEYRNKIVKDALSLGCTHLFFVDNDLLVDSSSLQKLYAHNLDVVGFKYVKKTPVVECASMISDGESKKPVPLNAKGLLEIDWSLTAGGTLYKMDIFKKIEYPWFVTTTKGTEDTYFCARLRENGIKAYLDNDILAEHVDRNTGMVYCCDGTIKKKNDII